MNNNDGQIPDFEKFPGDGVEDTGERAVSPDQDFAKSFETGVPEFKGDRFGTANPENLYYGEAKDDISEGEKYDAGIADAAALINYGLDAAAREMGVETVVQKIKSFDTSGRENPIGDLFTTLGVDTPEEVRKIRDEDIATSAKEQEFREGVNAPVINRSSEGVFKAIDDMKELIAEVEGADPRYEELRQGARAAGKGFFEYAVSELGTRGLTELFEALAQQREKGKTEDEGDMTELDKVEGISENKEGEQRETLNPEILQPDET